MDLSILTQYFGFRSVILHNFNLEDGFLQNDFFDCLIRSFVERVALVLDLALPPAVQRRYARLGARVLALAARRAAFVPRRVVHIRRLLVVNGWMNHKSDS